MGEVFKSVSSKTAICHFALKNYSLIAWVKAYRRKKMIIKEIKNSFETAPHFIWRNDEYSLDAKAIYQFILSNYDKNTIIYKDQIKEKIKIKNSYFKHAWDELCQKGHFIKKNKKNAFIFNSFLEN
jgi:uncharacterized protein YvpB